MNCECGCGLRAPVYRGRQCRYLRGHCGAQKAKKKIRYFVKEGTGCWIWLLCTRDGYGTCVRVALCRRRPEPCVAIEQKESVRWHVGRVQNVPSRRKLSNLAGPREAHQNFKTGRLG
jgi:hypothetical protein